MRSATDFLPSSIMLFMNLVTTVIPELRIGQDFALLGAATT